VVASATKKLEMPLELRWSELTGSRPISHSKKAFRVSTIQSRKRRRRKLRCHYQNRQRRVARRLSRRQAPARDGDAPVLSATNIHYDVADRPAATSAGRARA
jgi:hypothetical protein